MIRRTAAFLYNAASNVAFGLLVAGLAIAGALWLLGCGGSSKPAEPPSAVQTLEDCRGFDKCAHDLAEHMAAKTDHDASAPGDFTIAADCIPVFIRCGVDIAAKLEALKADAGSE